MNLGQALTRINGKCEWREDVHPAGPVLSLEIGRMPKFRCNASVYSARPTGGYRCRKAITREERQLISMRQIEAMTASQGEKLTFEQICLRAKCDFNQTTRAILQTHIEARVVEICGRGRAARYWLRKGT